MNGEDELKEIVAVVAAVCGDEPQRKTVRDGDGVDAGVLRDAVVATANDDGDGDDVGINHRVAVAAAAAKVDGVVAAAVAGAGGVTEVVTVDHLRCAAVVDHVGVMVTAVVVEVEVMIPLTNDDVGYSLRHHYHNSCCQWNHWSDAMEDGVVDGAAVVAVADDVIVVNGDDGDEGEDDFQHHHLSCQ